MIKILYILDHVGKMAGVTTIVYGLYKNMNKELFQSDFLVSRRVENSYEDEILKMGGKVFYSGNPLSVKEIIGACRYNKEFFRRHASEYDIVYLHSPTIAEMTIRYAKQYGVKNIIIHSHSSMFSPNLIKRFINNLLIFRIKKLANHFWYCSTEAAEFLYGKDFKALPDSHWVKNAIDCDKFSFDRITSLEMRKNLLMEKYKIALHVSNFSKIKNTSFLIDVIDKVTSIDKEWRFIFVGDGPERVNTENEIKGKGLEKYCLFLGFRNDVQSFMNAADLLLLPSLKEGLPIVTIEAQALGLKCFVTDTITHDADIGNVEYLRLVSEIWAEKILSFNPSGMDERERFSSIVKNGDFNIINETKNIEKLYQKIAMEK